MSDYNPGGFVPSDGPIEVRFTHPWKGEPILPLSPTPEQLEQAATIKAFQEEIDLIDTSWMDEQ